MKQLFFTILFTVGFLTFSLVGLFTISNDLKILSIIMVAFSLFGLFLNKDSNNLITNKDIENACTIQGRKDLKAKMQIWDNNLKS